MSYVIKWRLHDVELPESALRVWAKDQVKSEAGKIVRSAFNTGHSLQGEIQPLIQQELRDWVLRGGERFSPTPDLALDYYWKARRALPGFYDPLKVGVSAKEYLAIGASGEIGEGVALAVLEGDAPMGLGYRAAFRPLGTSPDFLCRIVNSPSAIALAEVKTTEGEEVESLLRDAVVALIEVYKAWQRHRPLGTSPGLAIAVRLEPGEFDVTIIRLRFKGLDHFAHASDGIEITELENLQRLRWCGDSRALMDLLVELLSSPDAAAAVSDQMPLIDLLVGATVRTLVSEWGQNAAPRPRIPPWAADVYGRLPRALGGQADSKKLLKRIQSELDRISDERASRPLRGDETWAVRDRTQDIAIEVTPWLGGIEARAAKVGRRSYQERELLEALVRVQGAADGIVRGAFCASTRMTGQEWTLFSDGRLLVSAPYLPDAAHAAQDISQRMIGVLSSLR